MAGEHTLELPMPPRCLLPNRSRGHWTRRVRPKKQYRQTVALLARAAYSGAPMENAAIQAAFYFTTRRRRDPDNLLAWLKPCFDGLVDAGWLADDCGVTHLPVRQEKATDGRERLVITVKEATHGNV